tara:strand:+ start:156 stop:437 length:282 start_codon:yes stop_codon:yes gene_type:complete
MWPFKKKIKETPKGRLYGNRHASRDYSAWDNLGFIEKVAMILLPIMITFIDFMITDAIFGLPTWITMIIAVSSTIVLIAAIYIITGYLTGRDY